MRIYETVAASRTVPPTIWARRERALELYKSLGFEAKSACHAMMTNVFPCPDRPYLDTGLVIFDDSYAFRRLYHMIKHHLDQSRKPKITA